MPIEKIMILEDDPFVRKVLEQQLRTRRYEVSTAGTLAEAEELVARDNFDLAFVDVGLPDGEGTDLLRTLQPRAVKPLVVVITGHGSIESAVKCMRDGAFDYIIKPFSADQIWVALQKAEEVAQLRNLNRFLSQDEGPDSGYELLGHSAAMEELRGLIRRVARTQATVLIQGESGTGKELVARAIYRESPRAQSPFIKVNCAAIPENLIESEFFGHEKGAFTGAHSKREGRFELAHGGTILLDEVSEVSPQVQAKLLRVLQERELERVGGNRTIKVDVRVLATTNRNLEQSVERKEFRQDLYFRLNVVPIYVPPLRDRIDDVPFLAEQFLKRFARKHGVRVSGIADSCMRALQAHSWPGNVRELQNVIERAVILCSEGEDVQVAHLGFAPAPAGSSTPVPAPVALTPIQAPVVPKANGSPVTEPEAGSSEVLSLAELEKQHILRMLKLCDDNRTHAARKLGISIRTLRNKLHEYGVSGRDDGDGGAE